MKKTINNPWGKGLDEALDLQRKISTDVLGFSEIAVPQSDELPFPVYVPFEAKPPVGAHKTDDRSLATPKSQAAHNDDAHMIEHETDALWKSVDPRFLMGTGVGRAGSDGDYVVKLYMQRGEEIDRRLAKEAHKASSGKIEIIPTGIITPSAMRSGASHAPTPAPLLKIGQSAAHHDVKQGTLGCFVERDGNLYALSNNHVFANQNRAKPRDAILSPCAGAGGQALNNSIAYFEDCVPLNFNNSGPNVVDCAIAMVDKRHAVDQYGLDFGGNVGRAFLDTTPEPPVDGMRVRKIGMSSNTTSGQIDAFNVGVTVFYDPLRFTQFCFFSNQISIIGDGRPFSRGGDSGALVVTEKNRPVGLLFAGTGSDPTRQPSRFVSFANPISIVLGVLQCTL